MANDGPRPAPRIPRPSPGGGLFFVIEGGEGSGKSVQAALLADRLRSLGRSVLLTREPGGTTVGEAIREILLHHPLTAMAELFLFAADRAEHVAIAIAPALDEGKIVICDRFAGSTVAYQGFGMGVDREVIGHINDWATGPRKPDLSIILDVPVEVGLARIGSTGRPNDCIEKRDRDFHERVRDGFLWLADRYPVNFAVVDGTPPSEDVHRAIWKLLEDGGFLRGMVVEGDHS